MNRAAATAAIDAFLRALGRDPESEPELVGTPQRVAAAYIDELLSGYAVDVDAILAANVLSGTSSTVVVRDIRVSTMCPHHLLPGIGTANVAFRPEGKLVGFGAIVQMVDAFSKRLVLQEALGEEIVASLRKHLSPRWIACRIELTHGCMVARGEEAHGSQVETFSFRGTDADRAEAMMAVRSTL